MDKIQLLETKAGLEKEAKLYSGLLRQNQAARCDIERQLAESYKPAGDNYTAAEVRSCRAAIMSALKLRGWSSPAQVVRRLDNHDHKLVVRELKKLRTTWGSGVLWNQGLVAASKYGIVQGT